MRKIAITGAAVFAAALTLSACGGGTSNQASSQGPTTTTSQSSSSAQPQAADRMGMFNGLNGKKVSGTVKVTGSEITLTGFSSDEGPDLHVYLTNGSDEAAVTAGKEISSVAFDKASQNFTVSGIDAGSYTTVVIHCDKAKAVFGAASLS
ncbi:DM13 domain-containing protein [Psychromicrobium sp. YIM B11713]|uniref:DM13 domain-containing protein n=1 Tax=Psychromicrobium sp. YIM B11713 TaxID=3145233 RepID=UPI00374F8B23